jgi:hypothetical protein
MPYLLGFLSIALTVGMIVHIVKTGRSFLWIYVVVFLPTAGAIAYFLVEVLPSLRNSRAARNAARAVRNTLDPHRDLRQYEQEVRVSGNVDSRRRLADELASKGQYAEAIATYRAAMTGLYEHDPTLMLGVARAQFASNDFTGSRTTLDELIRNNPDFRSPDGHLLYARSLESEGNLEKALSEYKALAKYYPGAEAKVRYAQLLKGQGDTETARTVLREVLDSADLAPAHYRKAQKPWLDLARREHG